MDVPLIETPQAITIIGRRQLEEQAPLTLQEALRYTSGISTDTYGAAGACIGGSAAHIVGTHEI
jgi:outer membrane receptor for monomeric catechols